MIKSHKSKVSLPYVMLHTFAYLVSALGLCAMYVHKETNKPEGSAFYEGHLYSVHSWAGVLAAALFTVQWLSAAATFMMPCLHSIGLPLGKMFSLYTTIVSTICLIAGVNQHAMKTLWVWWRYTIITGGLEIWFPYFLLRLIKFIPWLFRLFDFSILTFFMKYSFCLIRYLNTLYGLWYKIIITYVMNSPPI